MTEDLQSRRAVPGAFENSAEARRIDTARLRTSTRLLFGRLADTGVATLLVAFVGEGGFGAVVSVNARTARGRATDLPAGRIDLSLSEGPGGAPGTGSLTTREVVEALVHDHLRLCREDWDEGEGGYGTLTFDVATNGVRIVLCENGLEPTFSEFAF